MRPLLAFALALLLGVTSAACGADHAPTIPSSRESAGFLLDDLLPAQNDAPAVSDLTDLLRAQGALVMTSVRLGRRTLVTVVATNPFESPIGECKIIIIDNPTTRTYGPMPLAVGGTLVFTTFVTSAVTLDEVRVMGSLP